MGFTSFTQEFSSPNIAPLRLFRALILDSSNLIPKLLPQFISSIHVLQGNGGPGTIEQINFTQESGFKYVKHRIDEVDEENLMCKYTTIEGHPLADKVESVVFVIELGTTSAGGSVCKMTSSYGTKENMSFGEEEEIKAGEDGAVAIYKVVEAYLLDNPEAYA